MHCHFSDKLSYEDFENRRFFDIEISQLENALFIDLYVSPFLSKGQSISNEFAILLYNPHGKMVACCHNIYENMLKKGSYNIAFLGKKATYGAETGTEIIQGTWRVVLDVYRVMPYDEVEFHIDVTTEQPSDDQLPFFIDYQPWPQPLAEHNQQKKWYKGFIHGHSLHSDATWSVADFTHWLIEHDMDFGCLTDHNCWSHIPSFFAEAKSKITALAGVELTTFNGHANIIAESQHMAWRKEWEWRDFNNPNCTYLAEIAKYIEEIDGIFSINHPASSGSPFCSGCNWSEKTLFPGKAMAVEVWNRDWSDPQVNNEQALKIFYNWLNTGVQLIALAGPDIHNNNIQQQKKRIAYIEVLAENNSEAAIIKGIKSGAVCISSGPKLRYKAYNQNGQELPMGSISYGVTALTLDISYYNTPDNGKIQIIQNGKIIAHHPIADDNGWQFKLNDVSADTWIAIELRDDKGQLYAFANPIYFK